MLLLRQMLGKFGVCRGIRQDHRQLWVWMKTTIYGREVLSWVHIRLRPYLDILNICMQWEVMHFDG